MKTWLPICLFAVAASMICASLLVWTKAPATFPVFYDPNGTRFRYGLSAIGSLMSVWFSYRAYKAGIGTHD